MRNVSRIQLIKRQKVIKSAVFCVEKWGILKRVFRKNKKYKKQRKKEIIKEKKRIYSHKWVSSFIKVRKGQKFLLQFLNKGI